MSNMIRGVFCAAFFAAVLSLACVTFTPEVKAAAAGNVPASDANDWTKSLPVPPGTSLKDEPLPLQRIRLDTVKDVRQGNGYVWIAGQGSLYAGGAGSMITPPGGEAKASIEVTVMDTSSVLWENCFQILNSGKPVDIQGRGLQKFIGAGKDNASGRGVNVFKIDQLLACDLAQAGAGQRPYR